MAGTNDALFSLRGKRLILIAEDEEINRALLENILEPEYETIAAENGQQAMEKLIANPGLVSLVLLDLNMPGMGGLEVLRRMREDPDLSQVPVIVLTAESDSEVQSLNLGAVDFIPKPYPQPDVILARVRRTIELSESRKIISFTERDPLTGLLNPDYFYRYAERYDQLHPDEEMDAIVLDIYHFHLLNERFGRARGDEILQRTADSILSAVRPLGGFAARRGGDTFLIYCPGGTDYGKLLQSICRHSEQDAGERLRMRMGVFQRADKSVEMAHRFDRAKMAADTVRGQVTNNIAMYDDRMRERELYAERLIDDFPRAIAENQFRVFYQPKYDIRPDQPKLSSAEALVRWNHPELGMVRPDQFIPLFEENGLVEELDRYVWRTAARQIRSWREKFGRTLPVSVNVSRIDLYDPKLTDRLNALREENGLGPDDLLLEITESAYTGDSDHALAVIHELREMGFRIEVDDFGSGYSSLNMISTLPIDVLKLDMAFIRSAFREGGDTRMLEIMIDIARALNVPVIAEGVETEEQMKALRAIGCDIVQGYYFSRPVPPEEFEAFIVQGERGDESEC